MDLHHCHIEGYRAHTLGPLIPAPILALQREAGIVEDLPLHVPPHEKHRPLFEAFALELQNSGPNFCKISLVDDRSKASYEIVSEDDELVFKILDERVAKYGLTRVLETITPTLDKVRPLVAAAAHFHRNLNLTADSGETEVTVDGYPVLYPIGENLCQASVVEIDVYEGHDLPYGFEIINNTAWDLYSYAFNLENSDLSIRTVFTQDAVVIPKNGGTVTAGYGLSVGPPVMFFIPEGRDIEVTFLKVFLSRKPLDLSKIPQASPFDEPLRSPCAKAPIEVEPPSVDDQPTWASILVTLVQRRAV